MTTEKTNDETKTGYEGTGKEDTFAKVETEELEVQEETKDPIEVIPEEKETKVEKPKAEAPEDNELVFPGDEKTKEVEKEEEKEESKEKEEGEEPEDALKIPEEETKNVQTRQVEKELKLDWGEIAKETGFEGELESNTRESFINQVKQEVEDAKQKVAFDLSKFDENEQSIIKYFEGGGKAENLFNPLKKFYDFLTLSPKEKAKIHLVQSEKISDEDAAIKVSDLDDDGKLEEMVNGIDNNIRGIIETKNKQLLKESSDEYDAKEKRLTTKAKNEKESLVKLISDADVFMGKKLSKGAKAHLKTEIETGIFFEKNDTAQAQLNARLFSLFGNDIIKGIIGSVNEENRKGYNKGKEDVHADIHNIKTKGPASTGVDGGQRQSNEVEDPLAAFTMIDDEIVD